MKSLIATIVLAWLQTLLGLIIGAAILLGILVSPVVLAVWLIGASFDRAAAARRRARFVARFR